MNRQQDTSAQQAVQRPNIVWISTHDINPDLGCYNGIWPGAEYAVTPNLDQLATDGLRFDHAYAAAPICAPARSAIMTGCFPTAIGTMHMRTKAVPPAEVQLLPEYFRHAGYYCTNNSFTDFQVTTPPTAFDDCSPTGHWRNRPTPDTPFFAAFHGMVTHESQIYLDDDAFAEATTAVNPTDRHNPDTAPLPPYYPDTPVFRQSWARYADLITQMDHWVGTIIEELEEDGLTENTIVVFWSDHGKGMPRAKRWVNESGLREPLIVRWPGIIQPGTTHADLVHTMDLAPTMLAMCGLPIPQHMNGVPLIDQTGTVAKHPNTYVYGGRDRMDELEDMSRTVRDDRFRYIRHFHPDRSPMQHAHYPDHLATWSELRNLVFAEANQLAQGEPKSMLNDLQRSLVAPAKPTEELYDLLADPFETTNLATDPRHQADLSRLRNALQAWQDRYGDLGQLPESELIERWRPGGHSQTTEPPVLARTDAGLVATCPTPGASIGWTQDEPTVVDNAEFGMERITGSPAHDERHWNLYTRPLRACDLPTGPVWFCAWRLGFNPSTEAAVAKLADLPQPVSAGRR